MHALCADTSMRAKPHPVRTCSQFHIVQTSLRKRTSRTIVPRTWGTWFDRVLGRTVLPGAQLFSTRSYYKKFCAPRTCSC